MNEKVLVNVDKRKWRTSPLVGQIVLLSTTNKHGVPNVAPKSWISMTSFSPPTLGFGCNLKHRTVRNILETKEFVVNIPDEGLAKKVWSTGSSPHSSDRSIRELGFTLMPSIRVAASSIRECRAHLECVYDSDKRYDSEVWIFGKIVSVSVDKFLLQGSGQERYQRLAPIFYLEDRTYGVLGEIRTV